MGIPVSDVASQVAQELVNPPLNDAAKSGSSKFDQVLADKTGSAQAPVETLSPTAVEPAAAVEGAKVEGTPPGSPISSAMMKMMGDIEKGQGVLDRLINGGLLGKKQMSNTELIALQAGMYKYTQELELTGKVVEKATSGLKDTLKTQV